MLKNLLNSGMYLLKFNLIGQKKFISKQLFSTLKNKDQQIETGGILSVNQNVPSWG